MPSTYWPWEGATLGELCHSERALQFCGPGEVNVDGLDCKGKREEDGECAERTGGRLGEDKAAAGRASGAGAPRSWRKLRTLRSQRRLCRKSRTAPPSLRLPHRSPDTRSQLPQLGECFWALESYPRAMNPSKPGGKGGFATESTHTPSPSGIPGC